MTNKREGQRVYVDELRNDGIASIISKPESSSPRTEMLRYAFRLRRRRMVLTWMLRLLFGLLYCLRVWRLKKIAVKRGLRGGSLCEKQ